MSTFRYIRLGPDRYEVRHGRDNFYFGEIIDTGRARKYEAKRADGTTMVRTLGRWQLSTGNGGWIGFGTATLREAKVRFSEFYRSTS